MRDLNCMEQQLVSGSRASVPEQTGWVPSSVLLELRNNAGIRNPGLIAVGFYSVEPIVLPGILTGVGGGFAPQLPYEC